MSKGEPLFRGKDAIAAAFSNYYVDSYEDKWELLYDAVCEGYEQAEKATIERAIAWLKEHANDYIVDLTPTYPDAPVDIIVGGKCWDDLKEYLEEEK